MLPWTGITGMRHFQKGCDAQKDLSAFLVTPLVAEHQPETRKRHRESRFGCVCGSCV